MTPQMLSTLPKLPKGMANAKGSRRYYKDDLDISKSPYCAILNLDYSLIDKGLGFWTREADYKLCETLGRFLSGERFLCECNTFEFVIPCGYGIKIKDDETLVNYIFKDNPFVSFVYGPRFTIDVELLRESIRVLKIYNGRNGYLGQYRKFTLGFSTLVQMRHPVPDLSREQIANGYGICGKDRDDSEQRLHCALKAITQNYGALYCGQSGKFITYQPKSMDDMERAMLNDVELSLDLTYATLLKYAKILADPKEQKLLAKFDSAFYWDEKSCFLHSHYIGNVGRDGWDYFQIGVTLEDKYPWDVAKSVLAFIAKQDDFLEKCQSMGESDRYVKEFDGMLKFTFLCNFKAEPSRPITRGDTKFSIYNRKGEQWTIEERRKAVGQFIKKAFAILGAFAKFIDSVSPIGETDCENKRDAMKKNLAKSILSKIRLSPLDYVECNDELIHHIANYCISGEV